MPPSSAPRKSKSILGATAIAALIKAEKDRPLSGQWLTGGTPEGSGAASHALMGRMQGLSYLAAAIADVQRDNPLFDRGLFFRACEVDDPSPLA